MKQWPEFLMMSLRLFFRAKSTPLATWLALLARIAYGDRNPSRHTSEHPAGGPDPVAVLGAHVSLLHVGVMGIVGWSALHVRIRRFPVKHQSREAYIHDELDHCFATSAHWAGFAVGIPSKLG